jgi:hypothetical protein
VALGLAPPARIAVHLDDNVVGELAAAGLAEQHLLRVVRE